MDRTITFIRHGKTAGNLTNCYIGVTDEPLTLEGEKEIQDRNYPEADIVFSSPLIRCIRTSEIIYPALKPVVIDELRETNFGRFEGKNYKELSADPDYQRWIDSGGDLPFPEGESRQEATDRFVAGFDKLIELSKDYYNISVIAHGGTIMGILSNIFGGDYYSYHVENCEGYTIDLSHDGIFGGLYPRSFLR
ncbi:alpha-ribazole phosphatase [Pseudobutyrivibrio sp. UC1225]|uniref:histidine phosphatase family protein n=1 Tax=Pseudobutyrivibrio sp. UC1225 TaxID=1798185 RepID=UPI0008E5287B|nr:histidine phosphatase family protein [Pseudobutyrivibrio sp. UC1225]SFN50815.1 alpha-ribazole phosphatase [Pseudobutyrivibrio sp. UC1225]